MKNERALAHLLGSSKDVTHQSVLALLECLEQSPLVTKVIQLFKSGCHSELLKLSVNPEDYQSAHEFRDDYLAVSILSKFPFLEVTVDREAVALDKFMKAEEACRQANIRLKGSYAGGNFHHRWLSEVFYLAQRKIGALLPMFNWEDVETDCGFGPGASLSLNRRHGDAFYKFGNLKPTVTLGCATLAERVISNVPGWFSHLFSAESTGTFQLVPGNRVTTVPKNAKTDRVIAIEPDLNMYIQKGIGRQIRRSLRRVGINLDSQELNQELALWGSVHGDLATIDLSSASDSICTELVEMLLPPDWVDAINRCRSEEGVLPDGTVLTYQKVSSMGNGFTFELESLLFWALAESVIDSRRERDRRLAIYGDDIIITREAVPDLTTVLAFCGFTLNAEKSFWSGQFRESCGKHYFAGVDVTPVYVKDRIDTPERLFWWCNIIRRRAAAESVFGCNSRYLPAYVKGVSFLPVRLRSPSVPLIVEGQQWSDTALGGDFDEVKPKFNRNLQCYEAEGWVRVYSTKPGHGVPYLLKRLQVGQRNHPLDSVWEKVPFSFGFSPAVLEEFRRWTERVPTSGVSTQNWKYRKVKTCITQWGWVGPWV